MWLLPSLLPPLLDSLLPSLWILWLGLRLSLVALSSLERWRLGMERWRLGRRRLVVFLQINPLISDVYHDDALEKPRKLRGFSVLAGLQFCFADPCASLCTPADQHRFRAP